MYNGDGRYNEEERKIEKLGDERVIHTEEQLLTKAFRCTTVSGQCAPELVVLRMLFERAIRRMRAPQATMATLRATILIH